jgi:prevent-host-death family protein
MAEIRVSIGQVKRDISDLVNRVAYRGERVVLTSRGKPKAVLISMEDYERIAEEGPDESAARWRQWRADSAALSAEILARRGGQPIDVDALWQATRADLEARDDRYTGD